MVGKRGTGPPGSIEVLHAWLNVVLAAHEQGRGQIVRGGDNEVMDVGSEGGT